MDRVRKRIRTPPSSSRMQRSTSVPTPQTVLVAVGLLFHLFVTMNRSLQFLSTERILSSYSILPTLENQKATDTIPVFYNVYVANQTEHERVQHLVQDQLSNLQPFHHPIYVHTIGYPIIIPNTTLLGHHEDASELVTLHSLWEYCQDHPKKRVVYLHSKGSYHPSEENDHMRQLLTMGALSTECATRTDNVISNVCSYRFSPYPHPHTPGNMWMAHCSYVNNLMEPYLFHDDMNAVEARLVLSRNTHPSCVGNGRFAAEHWIHSHPDVKPSDMYNNSEFAWGYDGLRDYQEGDFEWKIAPRYPMDDWPIGCDYSDLKHRLKEYRLLYNITPSEDWWGWNFWLGPPDSPHWPDSPWKKRRKRTEEQQPDQPEESVREKKRREYREKERLKKEEQEKEERAQAEKNKRRDEEKEKAWIRNVNVTKKISVKTS
jgi:hypothetical protein